MTSNEAENKQIIKLVATCEREYKQLQILETINNRKITKIGKYTRHGEHSQDIF